MNLIQLAANSLIGLALPPILIHSLSKESFSAWTLIVQISMYIMYFDFGIQSAVAYFVAHTEERGETELRDSFISSAIALLGALASVGFLALIVMCWFLPNIFKGMSAALLPDVRSSILLLGFSIAATLPTSALVAIFIGQQRNQISAAISVIGRVLSAGLIVAVVLQRPNLIQMSAALAFSNLFVGALFIRAWKTKAAAVAVHLRYVSVNAMKRLLSYCYGLSIWTFSGLLISGLDTLIVGKVDFHAVGYYGVATTVTMFLVQAQGAVMRALVPTATVLSARSDQYGLNRVLLNSTRYGTLLLCWIGIPTVILARPLMSIWLGRDFASHSFPLLQVLLIANMVRLTFLPYATVITGVNQHNKIAIVGLAEGLINIVFSVFFGQRFGAIGVAFGTLIGAAASVLMHLSYSMSVTDSVSVKRSELLGRGFLLPFLSFAPWLLLWRVCDGMTPQISSLIHLFGFATALLLSWKVSIAQVERQKILASLSGLFSGSAVDKPA